MRLRRECGSSARAARRDVNCEGSVRLGRAQPGDGGTRGQGAVGLCEAGRGRRRRRRGRGRRGRCPQPAQPARAGSSRSEPVVALQGDCSCGGCRLHQGERHSSDWISESARSGAAGRLHTARPGPAAARSRSRLHAGIRSGLCVSPRAAAGCRRGREAPVSGFSRSPVAAGGGEGKGREGRGAAARGRLRARPGEARPGQARLGWPEGGWEGSVRPLLAMEPRPPLAQPQGAPVGHRLARWVPLRWCGAGSLLWCVEKAARCLQWSFFGLT